MKKDKAKKIVFKSVLGFACLAATFGTISSVSSLLTNASDEGSGGARTVASYFNAGEGVDITTNVNTPSYIVEKRNGVSVESGEGGTVTYNNLIDTTNLSKDDLLFEVQWTPETLGVYEFNQLVVRLEDSVDAKNYVEISLLRYHFSDDTNKKATIVTVTTNTISDYKSVKTTLPWSLSATDGKNPYTSATTTSIKSGVDQGRIVYGSFLGANGAMSDPVCIYYDDSERAIYTQNLGIWPTAEATNKNPTDAAYKKEAIQKTGTVDGNGKALVLDLDDASHMGVQKSNLWTGFPSGKAKMTVKTSQLVADSAKYMLLTLDGQTLDGTLINDTTAPELFVDLQGHAENALPKAQVGKTYPLFGATATDKMYGALTVSKRIYKDGEEIFFTGDGFIPTKVGEYQIDYIVYDGSRNKAIKSLYVTAENHLDGIEANLVENNEVFPLWDESQKSAEGNFQTDLYYPVVLPEMTATSDGGKVSLEKQVTYHGNRVPLNDNKFFPQWAGEYEVVYNLVDYVGNVKTFTYIIEANYSETPLLETPVLPEYIVAGKAYKFPAVQSQFYTPWQQKIKTYDKITLYKANGTTVIKSFIGSEIATYTPAVEDVGKIVVEYSTAANETATPVTYKKEIDVLPFENVKDLFVYSDGVGLTASSSDLKFSFTDGEQTVEFVHPVFVYDGLSITFNIPAEANNFAAVQFVLCDKLNADNYIVITIEKAALTDPDNPPTVSYLSVNEGKRAELDGASFYGNTKSDFFFKVMTDGSIYDNDNNLLVKDDNFMGFTSGFAYVEFKAIGIEGDSTVALKNINNQKIRDNNKDRTKPLLTVFEEPTGQIKLNEKINLSGAVASDVFDGNAKLTFTITFKGEEIYRAEDAFGEFSGCVFQPTDYGTYVVKYLAEDMAGYQIDKTYNIVVRDLISPVLEFQGSVPTTGQVGKALDLPTVVALDNVDWDLQVYVIVIDSMNTYTVLRVGEEYVPTYAGRHIVKYYCEDKNYNTIYSSDYVIEVE